MGVCVVTGKAETEPVVFYVLMVAVVNLGLGFTVAVFRARRCSEPLGEEAGAGVARSENRLDHLDAASGHDSLAGLTSEVGLEKELEQWWARESHRTKPVGIAMIDLDNFSQVNRQHGQKAGDRVLGAIGQLLAAESRQHQAAARLSGQRFLLLFADADARLATNVVERIRQLIELSHFRCEENDIRVTVSCAVTESNPDDTPESLLPRAEATLREAQRYGGNRTFLDEGGYPAPVVPPDFSLEDRVITI